MKNPTPQEQPREGGKVSPGLRIGDVLEVADNDGKLVIVCSRCRYVYGPADRDPKQGSVVREVPLEEASPLNALGPRDDMVCRQYFCPHCAVMISTNIHRRDDPHLPDFELSLGTQT